MDKATKKELDDITRQIIDPSVLMAQETSVITDDPPAQDMTKYLAGNIYLLEHLGTKKWLTIFLEQIESLMAKAPDLFQGVTIQRDKWVIQQAKLVERLGSDVWLIETITGLIGHTPKFSREGVWEAVEQLRRAAFACRVGLNSMSVFKMSIIRLSILRSGCHRTCSSPRLVHSSTFCSNFSMSQQIESESDVCCHL